METYHVGLIALALFGLMGFYAYYSWRRKISQQDLVVEAPEFIDFQDKGQKALYVASTFQGRPLDRLLAHGLAHRGKASVFVTAEGVSVYRVGEASFFVPARSLLAVSQNTAVIDRAVEKDGLTTFSWLLGDQRIESHFRFTESQARKIVVEQLTGLVGAGR
jgi:hypothetical protein